MLNFAEKGYTLVIGLNSGVNSAIVGSLYGVAQLASFADSDALSSDSEYPYFSRLSAVGSGYIDVLKNCALHYSTNGKGWTDVAVIASTNSFTISLAQYFIKIAEPEISILSFQQILDESTLPFDVELQGIKNSGARLFFGLIFTNWNGFIEQANSFGLIGENYVWFVPPTVSTINYEKPSPLTNGVVASTAFIPEDAPIVNAFVDYWQNADPAIYPNAGPGTVPSVLTYTASDTILAAAFAYDALEKQGIYDENIPPELMTKTIRNVTFEGVSGPVSFFPNGDRKGAFSIQYYSLENNKWTTAAKWSPEFGYEVIRDIYWYSNTTEIPDLDIRPPFNYWSCHDEKQKTDPTGKTVILQTPNGSDVDDIDEDYHCDNFIDCKNFSDEDVDCDSSYSILFIIFGILTGICILICVVLIVFVFIFGILLNYRRLRKISPNFLILLLITAIIGFSSIFTWFGKAHPVSCFLQPWLLGLPAISMITVLTVKNFRIYRIFRFPLQRVHISDAELFILWLIFMIPGIIIIVLWSAIATPTADMENGHYICVSRGQSGSIGTIIFFCIFVVYALIILLFGAFISIISRRIPSQFSETKLLTISIYHLAFLAIVVIPVNITLYLSNPYIAWIIRALAILYAFGATIFIQFVPVIIGIFVIDKGQNIKKFVPLNDKLVSLSPDDHTSEPSSSQTGNNSS